MGRRRSRMLAGQSDASVRSRRRTVGVSAPRRCRDATLTSLWELDLQRYLNVLARRSSIIALVVIVAVGVALLVTLLRPATWRATSTVQVQPGSAFLGGSVRPDDLDYVDRLVNTYTRLVTSERVVGPVSAQLGLHDRPGISAQGVPGTNLMTIQATTGRRADAAPVANAVAA